MPEKKKAESDAEPVTFSKEQILTFKRFSTRRDLLNVLLKDGEWYTMEQVENAVKAFMQPKGKVM